MSDVETAPVVNELPVAPVAPDFASMESVSDYRKAREAAETATSGETPAPVAEPPAPDAASEAGKELAGRKKSLQARIDEITREKHDTKREADTAKAEAAQLRAELAALRAGKPAAEPPAAQPETLAPQPLTKPIKPKQSDFEDFDAYETAKDQYFEDLADYKAKSLLAAEREASHAQAVTRAQHDALHSVYHRGRDAYADFDAVLESQANDGVRWSEPLTHVVLTHDHGHALAYALAKDAALAQRLSAIAHPITLGMEVGALVSRLETANSGPVSVAAPVTQAPDPIKPVGGSSTSASTADPSEIQSLAQYRARRKDFL